MSNANTVPLEQVDSLKLPNEPSTVARLLNSVEAAKSKFSTLPAIATPTLGEAAEILAIAFWTSLQKEEGREVRPIIVFQRPGDVADAFVFKNPVPLDAVAVTKLAPILGSRTRALGVTKTEDGKLSIWGMASPADLAMVVVVTGPGALAVRVGQDVLMYFSGGVATFLEGIDSFKLMSLITSASNGDSTLSPPRSFSIFFYQLLVSMREQGHGGTLLVVSPKSTTWRSRIASIRYEPEQPHTVLNAAILEVAAVRDQQSTTRAGSQSPLERKVRDIISTVGALTSVDGAVVLDFDLRVLGFGAMIKVENHVQNKSCDVAEPGGSSRKCRVKELGGARHQSAAAFCSAEQSAMAFVASQDGSLAAFGWQSKEERLGALERAELYFL